MSGARLIGVGVGPGDPELMTLKAMRALEQADVVAHFAKAGCASRARAIASAHLNNGTTELALFYPMTTELPRSSDGYRNALRAFYDDAAARIAAHLEDGRRVAVICEGDPLFYGSYMHLHARLSPRFPAEIVPGVTVHHIGGHSKGLQSVRVQTKRGYVVLAADATHLYAHMDSGRVFPTTYNIGEVVEGYRKLKKLASSPRHVVPGHDPLVLARYPAAKPGLEGWVVRLDAEPKEN